MIIAVDFDNTIARTTFPEIHEEMPGAIAALLDFQNSGHTVILWTCREGEVLEEAMQWLAERNFIPDCVNCHAASQIEEWGTDPRKVAADIYIDDRNIMAEINWSLIQEFVNKQI